MANLTHTAITTRIAALLNQPGPIAGKREQATSIVREEQEKARTNNRLYAETMRDSEAEAESRLKAVEGVVKGPHNAVDTKEAAATNGLKLVRDLQRQVVEYDRNYADYQTDWRGFAGGLREHLESLGVSGAYEALLAQRAEEIAAIKEVRSVIAKFDALERRAIGWVTDVQRHADPAQDQSELVDRIEGQFVRLHREKQAVDQAYSSLKDKIRKFDGMDIVKKSLVEIRQKRKVQKPFFVRIDAIYSEVAAQFAIFGKQVDGMLEEEKRLHRIKAEHPELKSRDSERQQSDIVAIVKDVALKQRECESAFTEITKDHRSIKANVAR